MNSYRVPDLPFSRQGLEIAVNLVGLWVMLEGFGFRPFSRRPPWRTPLAELIMWLLLAANTVLFAANLSTWLLRSLR